MKIEKEIEICEDLLISAMLSGDVAQLEQLLSDDLIFTDHNGQLIDKSTDLESYRSGHVWIEAIIPGDQKIKVNAHWATVSVKMNIKGKYQGQPFEGTNRYTRVWIKEEGQWRIAVGHASNLIKAQ